jgi:hypothetical protein
MPELPDDGSPAQPLEPAYRSLALSGTGQFISMELNQLHIPGGCSLCLSRAERDHGRSTVPYVWSPLLFPVPERHGTITRSRHDWKSRSATLYKALAIKGVSSHQLEMWVLNFSLLSLQARNNITHFEK